MVRFGENEIARAVGQALSAAIEAEGGLLLVGDDTLPNAYATVERVVPVVDSRILGRPTVVIETSTGRRFALVVTEVPGN